MLIERGNIMNKQMSKRRISGLTLDVGLLISMLFINDITYLKFMGIFAITQIPLAIGEGILTLIVYNLLVEYQKEGGFNLEKTH